MDWQAEAHETQYREFQQLGPLPDEAPAAADTSSGDGKLDKVTTAGTGKRLIELIAIKQHGAMEHRRKSAEGREGRLEDGVFKKKLGEVTTAEELKTLGRWPKRMPEKLVYVRSDKLNPQWIKTRDADKTKWSDVYKKGHNGRRTLDKAKLKRYAIEQVAKHTTLSAKSVFGEDLEGGASLTLGKWADSWNQVLKTEMAGSLADDGADIELNAAAQLMRFTYGGSLDGEFSVMDRRAKARAEGHVAMDFAKAQATFELYLPRKTGWLWTAQDSKNETQRLLATRCQVAMTVSGVVGASIAGELAFQVETAKVANERPKVKGKPGRKRKLGPKGKKTGAQSTVSINAKDEVDVAEMTVAAEVFAGAQATGTLSGTLEWRDPEHNDKAFEEIATIAPSAGGMVGFGAGGKFSIHYQNGVFRLTAHASLCLGLGGKGKIEFVVDTNQLRAFFKCISYKIAYLLFKNVGIFTTQAFDAITSIQFLAAQPEKRFEDFYMTPLDDIQRQVADIQGRLNTPKARVQLAERILSGPEPLHCAIPETKGMLICQLTRQGNSIADAGDVYADSSYMRSKKRAVMALLKGTNIKSEYHNIIQHIAEDGAKGDFDKNLSELASFFGQESIAGLNVTGYKSPFFGMPDIAREPVVVHGDFLEWHAAFYEHLMDRVPHGYALTDATSPAYEILRDGNDHPQFASTGWNAYYRSEA
ncbi:hypothetical protein [Pandoraea terrae]|uniref:hypothetical protein n=1 Tax=Pandoraea terrae TaxID=1537710 RepID=UPI0017829460|nr:hypothetical protein [Pandoraea terrae]